MRRGLFGATRSCQCAGREPLRLRRHTPRRVRHAYQPGLAWSSHRAGDGPASGGGLGGARVRPGSDERHIHEPRTGHRPAFGARYQGRRTSHSTVCSVPGTTSALDQTLLPCGPSTPLVVLRPVRRSLRLTRPGSANSPQEDRPRPRAVNDGQRRQVCVYAGQDHFLARTNNGQSQSESRARVSLVLLSCASAQARGLVGPGHSPRPATTGRRGRRRADR